MTRARASAVVGVLLVATALVGCTSWMPSFGGGADDPAAGAPGHPSEAHAQLTCDSMISPSLVEQFTEIGWTAEEKPFQIGPTNLPEGTVCTWADHAGPATSVLQMYGWAKLADGQRADLETYLEGQGWHREDDGDVTYLTEQNPMPEYADNDGYGMTYAFRDTQVVLSDTKQGTVIVLYRAE